MRFKIEMTILTFLAGCCLIIVGWAFGLWTAQYYFDHH